MGHKIFKVFRERNMLGYTFRDEPAQVFYIRFWSGKEIRPRGKGQTKSVEFDSSQAAALSARIPVIGFKAGRDKSAHFSMELQGLKVFQLSVPVLDSEYSDSPEAAARPFVVSLLYADRVLIKTQFKSDQGVRVGSQKDITNVFSGSVNYSRKHGGVVGAEKVFLGYRLSAPSPQDLARKDVGQKEIRKLAIFDLDDKTSDAEDDFLSFTMKHKLEEAFQGLPDFEVLTDRKEDAKYHLKGSYRKIGANRLYFHLALTNTYNKRIVGKPLTKAIKVSGVDELYDLQIEIVKEFVKPLGVKINKSDEMRLATVVQQTDNLDLVKEYQAAMNLLRKGKVEATAVALKKILTKDPVYLDALKAYGDVLKELSRYAEAEKQINLLLALARQKNDPVWEASALVSLGNVQEKLGKFKAALAGNRKALTLREKQFGTAHPVTADSYERLGWAYFNMGYYRKEKNGYKNAEKFLLKARAIYEKRYGPVSLQVAGVNASLGHTYGSQGKNKEALQFYISNVEIGERILGPDHPWTGSVYLSLGIQYGRLSQPEKARAYLSAALKCHRKVYSGDVQILAQNLLELGVINYNLKDYRAAEKRIREAAGMYERILGAAHYETKNTYDWLGFIYLNLGDKQNAAAFWKRAGTFEKNKGRLK